MANQQTNDPNQRSHQQGAPQNTQETPSSGNSPDRAAGTDERIGGSDVEGSTSGTATRMSPQTGGYGGAGATTGDPGRTPGKAEGVENPEDNGNQ
jgi:hypothetical protein